FGGHGLRGAEEKEAFRIVRDARSLQDAGAFSLVLEKIPMELAAKVTSELTIPTIGIASGPHCDGQILVAYDMLGIGKYSFRFARKYLDGRKVIGDAVSRYVHDIREGNFPNEDESYSG
ncbi:3-methyl-2-oxobutanoate hydroxymethyltransferase, partial [bacterium]|nr:3-methyl-2-oxobutanoate hydroxymethyltransferase [bacterium]